MTAPGNYNSFEENAVTLMCHLTTDEQLELYRQARVAIQAAANDIWYCIRVYDGLPDKALTWMVK